MKKLFLILLLLLFTFNCFSQTNEVRFYYGVTDSKLLQKNDLDGAAGYDINNSYELGFRYLLFFNNNLALETGINYWAGEVTITSAPMPEQTTQQEYLKITSIPIFGNYNFLNYFYINVGPVMDFQASNTSFHSQSGIGFGLGVGAIYNFQNFRVFINPNFKRHAVIPFEKENYHQKLTSFGLQFGLGYGF